MGLTATFGDAARAWRGGALYAYTNGSADGYVWETRWSNETTAERFLDAYRGEIRSKDGSVVSEGVWRVPDGPFADAFALNRTGNIVRIVNAPSVSALLAVHDDAPSDRTHTPGSATDGDGQTMTAEGSGPGFGPVVALVAIFVGITAVKNSRLSGRGR